MLAPEDPARSWVSAGNGPGKVSRRNNGQANQKGVTSPCVSEIISGAKRVTVIGPKQPGTAKTDRVIVQERHDYGAAEKLKFTVIKPTGEVQRGELLLDLGRIKRDSRPLRPLEKRMRQLVRAEYRALGRYLGTA